MIILWIAMSVMIVDQIVKYLVNDFFSSGVVTVPVIPSVFHVTYVENTGVAFGLFKGNSVILFSVITLSIIAMIVYVARTSQKRAYDCIAYGLIFGGAGGNIIDRLFRGYVVDFLDFRIWPVFNIADICISVGVGLIILDMFFTKNHESTVQ